MKIYCFGDSNTYGYDARMLIDNRYPPEYRWVDILASRTGWSVLNKGLNGREIPPAGIHVPKDTDLLIIMLGTNDLLQGNDVDAVLVRMKRFLEDTPFSREKMLLLSPVPMQLGEWVPKPELVDQSHKLAEGYRELAASLGIRFADAGEWGVSLTYDGIHYTEKGQIVFANRLHAFLTT